MVVFHASSRRVVDAADISSRPKKPMAERPGTSSVGCPQKAGVRPGPCTGVDRPRDRAAGVEEPRRCRLGGMEPVGPERGVAELGEGVDRTLPSGVKTITG